MTREEREAAIAFIKGYRKLDEDLHNTAPKNSVSYYATAKCLKYWDMAIQALSQEPCDDVVSRQAVINAIENDCMKGGLGSCFACYNDAQAFRGEIEKLPSATHKSGKWKQRETDNTDWWECSECGAVIYSEHEYDMNEYHRFCGRCGAKMVEPQESEKDACKDCYYNDGEVHAECVVCEKAERYEWRNGMTKTVCDVCGKEIGSLLPIASSIRDYNFCISSYGKKWDVCNECREELNIWMNERKSKARDSK